ncbi:tetratricopeptide repeat protein [Nocardia sp. NBC_01009]|uniref:tetratricopeptide repeat protein n=1 Tax=Nocardia sp. NBC_01009 TaxID=2975996 RepID=UPI00386F72E8|nr:tetratricopeptide repeat protein [Nocardia sp. NBC_01009]
MPAHFLARTQQQDLRAAVRRSRVAVVVTGMRGVGKTQLAAAVARDAIDTGQCIVGWVNAETLDTTRAGLAEIAIEVGVGDPDGDSAVSARRLLTHLSGSSEPGLLVFDNACDPDRIRGLLPAGGGTRVVITSTDQRFATLGETIGLAVFTRTESVGYLTAATGLPDPQGAALVAAEVGDLPLALSAAAGVIATRRLDYTRYLSLLASRPLPSVLKRQAGHDYQRPVVQAIVLSLDSVEAATSDDAGADAVVRWLIGVVAMLSPAGVPRWMLPEHDDDCVDEAVARCVAGSVLSWSATDDTLIMHRLVGRVVRERAQSTTTGADLVTAAVEVIEPCLFGEYQAWSRREHGSQLIEQIDALWATGLPRTCDTDLATRVLSTGDWAGRQLIYSADLTRAITHAVHTLAEAERLFGPDHPNTLVVRNTLAYAYESAGQLDEAIPLHETTLADCEWVLGPDHRDTLTSRSNLAYAYQSAGQLDKAIPLHETTLTNRKRVLGPDHPSTLTSRSNLAYAYQSAGQLDKAIPLHKTTVKDRKRVLGPDHPDTLVARNNLADAYHSAGQLDKAIPLHETTLTNRKRVLGPDHPDTFTSRNNLASAYQSAGQLDKAIPLYKTTLTDSERVLGPDHPTTIVIRNNLAGARIHEGPNTR